MAITLQQETSIMKMASALFNKAFNPEMVTGFVSFYESNNNDLSKLADALIGSSVYTAQYNGAATVAEYSTILMAHYGLSYTGTTAADTNMKDFIAYSFTNKASWATSLQTIQAVDKYLTATFVPSITSADPIWGTMAKANVNKAEVAIAFKNNPSNAGKELSLASVTDDRATVDAATDSATAGQTFTLTTGADTGAAFKGTDGNDVYTAVATMAANGTTLVDTLQSIDSLDGGAGKDTLNVTFGTATGATPTLNNIEIINLRATAAADLNLSAATGVTNVNVINSTAIATISNIGNATVGVKNQKQNVDIKGSTATALKLDLDTVGDKTTNITVNLGAGTANAATSLDIKAKDAYVTFSETTAGVATTSATIAATGTNKIAFVAADLASLTSVSVTGAGSTELTGNLTAVKTVTVADGGVNATINNQTAGAVTVTTGAGKDTLSINGAGLKSATTGAGDDVVTVGNAAQTKLHADIAVPAADAAAVKVLTAAALAVGTITAAQKTAVDLASDTSVAAAITSMKGYLDASGVIAATATVDLGAGDDTLTLGSAFATGATINGGDGKDTIAMNKADYATVAVYTAPNLAKITGFEVLSITDALIAATNLDISKIAGITSFKAAAGITVDGAKITKVGANSTIELAGVAANDKSLTASFVDGVTATTLILNKDYTDDNNTVVGTHAAAHTVVMAEITALTVNSTGNMAAIATKVDGYKADLVTNTLTLDSSNKLVSVTVNGDQALSFTSTAAMTKLATIDASTNTGGLTFNGNLAAEIAMTIKGSATAANTLTGTKFADTITGGSANDVITGGAKGDTLSGNGGNDKFVFAAGDSKISTGDMDKITDFVANTYGAGANGVADKTGATTDATKINGDTISFAKTGGGADGVVVDVFSNASNATTFLANNKGTNTSVAALDSSTGYLYIDNVGADGVADLVIHLSGVTTIDAAAFVLI